MTIGDNTLHFEHLSCWALHISTLAYSVGSELTPILSQVDVFTQKLIKAHLVDLGQLLLLPEVFFEILPVGQLVILLSELLPVNLTERLPVSNFHQPILIQDIEIGIFDTDQFSLQS